MPRETSLLAVAWYSKAPWLWLLRPLELIFRVLTGLRKRAYQGGLLKSWRAPVPVVIVGNITVGGTGKTPIVIALVEHLQALGLRPGVVSRGYGADANEFPHTVSSHSSAADCGDEPLLIYRRTGCPCVVAPDRTAAVRQLLESSPVDVILADDGLQHYRLERDLEIVVLDEARGIGNGFCLPAGPLREPPGRLEEADFVLHRGSDNEQHGVRYRHDSLVNVATGAQRPIAPDATMKVVSAVAGIGQPEQFFNTLLEVGYTVQEYAFPDHHHYTAEDFAKLPEQPVIMTEKDAVKCADLAGNNAWYLKISAELPPVVTDAVVSLATSHQQDHA